MKEKLIAAGKILMGVVYVLFLVAVLLSNPPVPW